MERIKNFFAMTNTPLWVVVLGFLLTFGLNYVVGEYKSKADRVEQTKVAAYVSFENKATEFNVLFGSFAYGLMNQDKVDEKAKGALIDNLNLQHTQIEFFQQYATAGQVEIFSKYKATLYETLRVVRTVDGFDALGQSYRLVGTLLDQQRTLIKDMRVIAGITS